MKQWLVVLGIIGAFISVMTLVAYLTGGGAQIATEQRFKAKPGTTRDNAVALSSRKRKRTQNKKSTEESQAARKGKPVRVRSLSETPEEAPLTEHQRDIREAMNSLSPEDGLDKLQGMLDGRRGAEEESEIYAAMAALYQQLDPPRSTNAREAFERAMASARSTALRRDIALREASFLIGQGETAAAQQRITGILEEGGAPTPVQVKLEVLSGQLDEQAERKTEAEKAYRSAIEHTLEMAKDAPLDDEGTDALRLACLRLSQLYQATGREKEAADIAARLKQYLARNRK